MGLEASNQWRFRNVEVTSERTWLHNLTWPIEDTDNPYVFAFNHQRFWDVKASSGAIYTSLSFNYIGASSNYTLLHEEGVYEMRLGWVTN